MPARFRYAVVMLLSIAAAPRAQQPTPADAGVTGRILSHDGSPVTGGNISLLTSSTSRVDAAIDRRGQFRIVPERAGEQSLFISVTGHAPYRASVTVPSSRAMALPDITLDEATYFRARFATADGDQLAASLLRMRSLDIDEFSIPDPLGHSQQQIDPDGTLIVGPLPGGRTLMALDRPGFAQTRLRDVNVNRKQRVIEGGTIVIDKGAALHVDVFDAKGQAVPRHDVWLEDANQPSLLSFPVQRTSDAGRAVFDRLAPGRYRVSAPTAERCGTQRLTVSKLATVGRTGPSRARLVIDGRVAIRITSPVGPMFGRSVTAAPDAPETAPWQPRLLETVARRGLIVPRNSPPSCGAVTDNDGRSMLTPFPPGPAIVRVRLFNSTYVTRITVPEGRGEVVIAVPDGLIAVRVTNRVNQHPVSARIIWTGGGGQVEATTTANGDALIEGVGAAGGTMTITASQFQTLEGAFAETPETLQEIALAPAPSRRPTVHVVNEAGDAIGGAIVQLLARGPADAPQFAAADARGAATFLNVADGSLQLSAHADGFKPAVVRVAEEDRASIRITLTRAP